MSLQQFLQLPETPRGGMQIDGINGSGHFNRLSIVASKQLKMFQLN